MPADELRERFLRDRVMTATPAQRIVMIYDRLALDLARAVADTTGGTSDIDHAVQVVVELRSSLDLDAGGPAENLHAIYGYLIRELIAVRGGDADKLPKLVTVVDGLRQAWTQAAEELASGPRGIGQRTDATAPAGAWVS